MNTQRLPEDLEAERALLATLCAPGNEHSARLTIPSLRDDDFVHPAHRAVFAALGATLRSGLEVNAITLRDQLERDGLCGRVGGYQGLVELLSFDEVGRPQVLADLLARKRRQRELMRLAWHLARRAADEEDTPEALIHEAQQTLARIAQSGVANEAEGWMEILHQMSSFEPFRVGNSDRGGWWGIPSLDDVAPIPAGEFAVVGARPGVGKTALMTQIGVESARRGIKTLIVSLELPLMTARARIASHLTAIAVPSLKRGDYNAHAVSVVGQQSGTLEFGRLVAPPAGRPWPQLEALIRQEVDRYGVSLVLLDQFDKIGRPAVTKGSSEAYAFGAVSTGILGLAKDLSIGFVLLAQLKGDAEGREPGLGDFADSDRPAKDGGVVLGLYRDRSESLKAKILKNRDGAWVGRRIPLDFRGEAQRFREMSTDESPSAAPSRGGSLL